MSQTEMEMQVEDTQTRTFQGVEQTEFDGMKQGIDVQVDCPHDSEQWVRTVGGMNGADLSDVSSGERGDIAEQHAAPEFARDRGRNVLFVEGTGESGFDIVACDDENDDGECEPTVDTYHIIEAKFKSDSGSVGIGYLDTPDKGRQMSTEWIANTIDETEESEDEQIQSLGEDLERVDSSEKEIVAVQNDEQNSKTVVNSLNRPGISIDYVHIVKLEEVIET